MRLGIDTTWMGDNPAGVGTFAGEVIKELEGREDLELVLFSAKDTSWRKHLDIYQEIKEKKIDVLWQLGDWLPLLVPSGVKTIQTVHDLMSYDHPEWFPQGGLSRTWSQRIRVPRAIKSADVVHAISSFTSRQVSKIFNIESNVVMAYQGVGVPDDIDQDRTPGNLKGTSYLVMVGTIEPRKNIEAAIEAFKIVTEKYPDDKLVIMGKKGWGTERAMETIENAGDSVQYLGYVDDPTKFAILKGARGLVMTSFAEGFGRPLVEAMRLGVPVVASATSGMKEVAEDAGIMVFVDDIKKVAHGMERLLHHDELRGKLVTLGYERVKRFDTKRMVDSVLEKLLERDDKHGLSD
ncbi:glycosyltransferase family 4 protein [Candidatus Uhrbacteria bacterium]|jgi:glycosyltransferase involved in cell wall biosynthesis|nr:glycosyltransferase family 4 protein [Candidatus Uhrbacteria bacterium]